MHWVHRRHGSVSVCIEYIEDTVLLVCALSTLVKSVIYECWRAGENKELGKEKISAAGV